MSITQIHYRTYKLPGQIDSTKPLSTEHSQYENKLRTEVHGFESPDEQYVRFSTIPTEQTYLSVKFTLADLTQLKTSIDSQTPLTVTVDGTTKQRYSNGTEPRHTRQQGTVPIRIRPVHHQHTDISTFDIQALDESHAPSVKLYFPPSQAQDFHELIDYFVQNDCTAPTGPNTILTPTKLHSDGHKKPL